MSDQEKASPAASARQIHSLYQLIQTLRTTAVMRYEVEKSRQTPDSEIAKIITPITNKLREAQLNAVQDDFDGVCHAITQFDLDADAFMAHANYMIEKAKDLQTHAETLKTLLLERMKASGEQIHTGLFHSATIIESLSKGKRSETLIVR